MNSLIDLYQSLNHRVSESNLVLFSSGDGSYKYRLMICSEYTSIKIPQHLYEELKKEYGFDIFAKQDIIKLVVSRRTNKLNSVLYTLSKNSRIIK